MRYYFHVYVVDGRTEVDDIGADFPSEAVAINEARSLVREMMEEAVSAGSSLKQHIEVTDGSGRTIVLLDGRTEIEETHHNPSAPS